MNDIDELIDVDDARHAVDWAVFSTIAKAGDAKRALAGGDISEAIAILHEIAKEIEETLP